MSPLADFARIPVIAIIGPTAVGKTALSLLLAERIGAEIVSVDSRQVYRYLDVGTDKISADLRRQVIHHLIDVSDPDEVFSAADFVVLARDAVRRMTERGRIPLFVGGTPFYFEALFGSTLSDQLPKDEGLRRELEGIAQLEGREALHGMLRAVDGETADRLHPNDVRRVVRSLEIYRLTGRPASELYRTNEKMEPSRPYDVLYIGLNRQRKLLFETIKRRVREQFAAGYVDEVAWLLSKGFDERFPSMQGFGYREILEHLRGACTLEEAMDRDASKTKAFSRRQMTWFSKFSPAVWYDTTCRSVPDLADEVEREVRAHLER